MIIATHVKLRHLVKVMLPIVLGLSPPMKVPLEYLLGRDSLPFLHPQTVKVLKMCNFCGEKVHFLYRGDFNQIIWKRKFLYTNWYGMRISSFVLPCISHADKNMEASLMVRRRVPCVFHINTVLWKSRRHLCSCGSDLR